VCFDEQFGFESNRRCRRQGYRCSSGGEHFVDLLSVSCYFFREPATVPFFLLKSEEKSKGALRFELLWNPDEVIVFR